MTRRLYEDEADLDRIPVLISIEGIIYYLDIVLLNTIVLDYLGMYMSSESSVIVEQCNRL